MTGSSAQKIIRIFHKLEFYYIWKASLYQTNGCCSSLRDFHVDEFIQFLSFSSSFVFCVHRNSHKGITDILESNMCTITRNRIFIPGRGNPAVSPLGRIDMDGLPSQEICHLI